MDAHEFNKIAGAVLAALLVLVGSKVLVDQLMGSRPEPAGHPVSAGYPVPVGKSAAGMKVAERAGGGEHAAVSAKAPAVSAKATASSAKAPARAEAEASGEAPLPARLKEASAERGGRLIKRCAVCHTFTKGGRNKVGPNLYGVVGRRVASHEGFAYSAALGKKGGTWTFEALDCFLTKTIQCVPGTKMAFVGIKKPAQRADVLLFLRGLSDNPAPLP